MKNESERLTAVEFFEKLQQDKLDVAMPFSIAGMVKKSEGSEKTIELAPGGNCSNWVTIPIEFIEQAEVMKTIPCKDHTHPLVRLTMKTPVTPEGKVFLSIIQGMMQTSGAVHDDSDYSQKSHPVSDADAGAYAMKRAMSSGFGGGSGIGLGIGTGTDNNCYEVIRIRCYGGMTFCYPYTEICCIKPDGSGRTCFEK